MLSKLISVKHDVSIQGMLQLDDMDNILISHNVLFRRYHDMILARLIGIDSRGVKIHVRPGLLNMPIESYLPYVQQGIEVVVWQDGPKIRIPHHANLTIVHISPTTPLSSEGFLVIKAPVSISTRMLATWQMPDNRLVALLVTNSHTVEKISDQLDVIIQSATT